MAFPVIETADTQTGVVTGNTNPWTTPTYPTNLVNGDLILGFIGRDGTGASTWPAGWVKADINGASQCALHIAKKVSDGTESGTFSVTLAATEQGGWAVLRITNWEGTLGTGIGNISTSGAVVSPAGASGTSANPDPPSLDPFNWATEDTLWFAVMTADTSRTISVYPLSDNQTELASGGAGGATLGFCTANSAVSSLDPGTFTISASDEWGATTIAIRPGAGAPPPTTSLPDLIMAPPIGG